jgi:glycyl-tRNA synthetase
MTIIKNIDMTKLHDKILEIAISRGILIPSAQIYGSSSGFYDYGPIGSSIKRKIVDSWRELFVIRPGFLEIESSLLVPTAVLVASGHADNFTDPVCEDVKTGKRFRADKLLEEATGLSFEAKTPAELDAAIKEYGVRAPDTQNELTAVHAVNLMFGTKTGDSKEDNAFLRPETAQGIFVDFKRIFLQNGSKLPLAIAQTGRSFRNEIAPRQGLIRMREFSQMELEYFFNPKNPSFEGFENIKNEKVRIKLSETDEVIETTLDKGVSDGYFANQIMAAFIYWQHLLCIKIGIKQTKFHFAILPKDGLPHYSKANVDLEIDTSYGRIEGSGTAYRTDYDLTQHAKHSKQDMSVKIAEEVEKFVPHVVEPSIGVDRLFYSVLESCYREKSEEKQWEWFAFPPSVAPYTVAVFPLMKKDGLPDIALKIVEQLREQGIDCYYSKTGSIGKRYAKADEIGIPYCLTIDYQSKEQEDVTLRFRDDGGQQRIKISHLSSKILECIKKNRVTKQD